jgi:hypothetical protein
VSTKKLISVTPAKYPLTSAFPCDKLRADVFLTVFDASQPAPRFAAPQPGSGPSRHVQPKGNGVCDTSGDGI